MKWELYYNFLTLRLIHYSAKMSYIVCNNAVVQCRFWAIVCKTVSPMLSDHCPVLSVCNVGVLWPNGWMDQNETWHEGR